MRQFTDEQRIRLLEHMADQIDGEWLDLFGKILDDRTLPNGLKAYFLRIDEQPLDREFCTWVRELVLAREKLMMTVNRRFRDRLLALFLDLDTYNIPADASPRFGIEDRFLKQVLLDLITVDDSPESHGLILDHFRKATMANDRVAALLALNRSSSPVRRDIMEEVYKNWYGHLSGYANYLRVVASGTCDDVFERIAEERSRPTFDVNIPTWSRALFLPMAANNKMVWTDRGIQWITDTIIELAPINATTTSRLLNTFQHVQRLKPELQEKVRASLDRILTQVSLADSPTVHGQAKAYLGA
jgi:aminopeptidase N